MDKIIIIIEIVMLIVAWVSYAKAKKTAKRVEELLDEAEAYQHAKKAVEAKIERKKESAEKRAEMLRKHFATLKRDHGHRARVRSARPADRRTLPHPEEINGNCFRHRGDNPRLRSTMADVPERKATAGHARSLHGHDQDRQNLNGGERRYKGLPPAEPQI